MSRGPWTFHLICLVVHKCRSSVGLIHDVRFNRFCQIAVVVSRPYRPGEGAAGNARSADAWAAPCQCEAVADAVSVPDFGLTASSFANSVLMSTASSCIVLPSLVALSLRLKLPLARG